MKIFLKYYPFWLGLICCILIIEWLYKTPSFAVLLAYLMGYFKLTKFHE